MASRQKSLRTTKCPCSQALKRNLRKAFLVLAATLGEPGKAAIPLSAARMGLAAYQLPSSTRSTLNTWGECAAFRLGVLQERHDLIAGLDLQTLRLRATAEPAFRHDMLGDELSFFIGKILDPFSFWGSIGGGQLRIKDRPDPLDRRARLYVHRSVSFGFAYDIYRAQHGKIDVNANFFKREPDQRWRSAYSFSMINALQLELSFRLLGW